MKLYQVGAFPTLNGEAAGPDEYNYLAFEQGDIVAVVGKRKRGVVEAVRLEDKLVQELDKDSLLLIGSGLKLTPEYNGGIYW